MPTIVGHNSGIEFELCYHKSASVTPKGWPWWTLSTTRVALSVLSIFPRRDPALYSWEHQWEEPRDCQTLQRTLNFLFRGWNAIHLSLKISKIVVSGTMYIKQMQSEKGKTKTRKSDNKWQNMIHSSHKYR